MINSESFTFTIYHTASGETPQSSLCPHPRPSPQAQGSQPLPHPWMGQPTLIGYSLTYKITIFIKSKAIKSTRVIEDSVRIPHPGAHPAQSPYFGAPTLPRSNTDWGGPLGSCLKCFPHPLLRGQRHRELRRERGLAPPQTDLRGLRGRSWRRSSWPAGRPGPVPAPTGVSVFGFK